jgi:hypothetical protein
MLFAGTILTTTVLEWIVVRSGSAAVKQFWFEETVDQAETALVLPGLTASIVSGIAQCWLTYERCLKRAPLHVKLPLHILSTFGLWWLWTDLRLRGARAATDDGAQIKRRWSNVVSCLFLLVLYGVMVLKPGHGS